MLAPPQKSRQIIAAVGVGLAKLTAVACALHQICGRDRSRSDDPRDRLSHLLRESIQLDANVREEEEPQEAGRGGTPS